MRQFFLRTAIIFSFLLLIGFSVKAQHSKTCGSDHMTDLIKQQFPQHADEWEDFHQRVIPALIEHQPTQQRTAATILRIPVAVHVIHSGEAIGTGSNLSVAQIQAQLDILNEDFSAQNANFNQTPSQWSSVIGNPDIQFCLANVDPSGNPSNGITRHNMTVTGTDANNSNIEDDIKPPTTWNSNIYYNIWTLPIPGTTANGGTVGYAYLPNNFTIGSNFDGTVVDWRWFGGPGFSQSGYKTLTHETGHYLGLPHTFNETDCNGDDNIDDTPNISAATASLIPSLSCSDNNFPSGPNSCGNEHMYVNYMDYVNVDYCYTSFTEGQIAVMRGVLEGDSPFNYGSRSALVNNSNTACASAANNIGITSVTEPTAGTNCTPGPVTPQVTVGNFGTDAVSTFSVSYQIDNGALVTENFVDNIASGGTVTITLPVFTPPTAAYNFTVYTQNPNGVIDSQTDNDTVSISSVLVNPLALPLLEDFTNTAIDPTAAGSYPFNPDADDFAWQHVPTSAYGSTGGSLLFDNFEGSNTNNPFGTIDAFISPVLDLTNSTNTVLTFDVAYVRYDNSGSFFTDSLRVLVSTDCGSNYNELVFNEGGATLETGTPTSSAFTPSATEWATKTINLNNYDGQGSVSVAFVNVSGWGNRLFVDNINITADANVCELVATPVVTDALCFEEPGLITVVPQGGTEPYTYQWENGSTDDFISEFPGVYFVTVTDAAGCTDIAVAEILEPAPILIQIDKTDETSAGANDGSATAVVSGGTGSNYTFNWSNQATTASVNNLAPGTYSVTVTDQNGCNENASIVIGEGQVNCNLVTSFLSDDIHCFGEQGVIQAFAQGGTEPYTFLWENGQTDDIIVEFAGIYFVTVTDAAGCTDIAVAEILEPAPILIQINKTDETSAGANDGSATAVVSGGTGSNYTFNWSNQATTASINNLAPGTYSVTVTDQNGCTENASILIESGQIDCNLVATINTANTVCFGENGLIQVFAEGGTEPYSYAWDNGQNDNVLSAPAGVYSVTVTDANGCTDIAVGEIIEHDQIIFEISKTHETTMGANDGSAIIGIFGGTGSYSINWSNGSTGSFVSNLAPGDFSVTVTDENGCTKTDSCVIQPGSVVDCSQLSLILEPSATSCADSNDGSINATVNGGSGNYEYNWSNGMTTENISNLPGGTYQLTVTDQLGCTLSKTTIVNAPPVLVASLSATENAFGSAPPSGTATVNASGGVGSYDYQWSNGGNTATIDGLSAGNYAVTVLDNNECIWMGSIEVENEALDCSNLNLNINSVNISCSGAEDGLIDAVASGGSAEYIYQWNNGMTTASISNLSAGTYQLTVTDINGCSVIETTQITEAAPLIANLTSSSDPCNSIGGTLSVDPIGGTGDFTVEWSNGISGFTNAITQSGNYQVTITDAAGCTTTDATSINVSNSIMEFNIDIESVSCSGDNDGSATATVAGGSAPYQYEWSTGSTENIITDLSEGTYSVEITDAMGCSRNQIFTISAPAPIILTCSGTLGLNEPDGFVQVSGFGGSAPYQYEWSTGNTGSFIQGLDAGIYDVTVTDQNGCTSMCSIDLIPTSTETPDNITALKVFPNPTSNQLFIQADLLESEMVKISLVNLIGQTVRTETTNGTTIRSTIQVADLATGTYFLRLETAKGAAIRKVVIF